MKTKILTLLAFALVGTGAWAQNTPIKNLAPTGDLTALMTAVESARLYPVFVLPMGQGYYDFELKASIDNFTNGDLVYFLPSAGTTTNATLDPYFDTSASIFYTSNLSSDQRVWQLAVHQSLYVQTGKASTFHINQVVVIPSKLPGSAAWMYKGNTSLVWSYMRITATGPETDANGNRIWNPIVPIDWRAAPLNPPITYNKVSYDQYINAGIDPLIAGLTPSAATEEIYDSCNPAAHSYHRNATAWFARLDLTGISAWVSAGPPWHVTALSPGWVISANHVGNLAGQTADFVDKHNTTWTVTIGNQVTYGVNGDRVIYPISPRLPSSITPAAVLPSALPSQFTGVGDACFFTNQQGLGLVGEIYYLYPNGPIGAQASDTIESAVAANRMAWTVNPQTVAGVSVAGFPLVLGDSTSPYGMFLGGKFVLLGCAFQNDGNGPDPGAEAVNINAVMAANSAVADGTDSLTVITLPNS